MFSLEVLLFLSNFWSLPTFPSSWVLPCKLNIGNNFLAYLFLLQYLYWVKYQLSSIYTFNSLVTKHCFWGCLESSKRGCYSVSCRQKMPSLHCFFLLSNGLCHKLSHNQLLIYTSTSKDQICSLQRYLHLCSLQYYLWYLNYGMPINEHD